MNFLFHLWNLHENINIFKNKIVATANVFPNLKTVQDLVKGLPRKHLFGTSFHNQHVKESQTLVKWAWEHFYRMFLSLLVEVIWEISPLL